jgi:hypothetical protein
VPRSRMESWFIKSLPYLTDCSRQTWETIIPTNFNQSSNDTLFLPRFHIFRRVSPGEAIQRFHT